MKSQPVKRRALLATLLFSGVVSGCTARVWGRAGSPSKITMRFELPDLTGNPFDFAENDVQVELASGGKTFTAPAFFDGGTNWEMRCVPPAPGAWKTKRVTRNGQTADAKNIAPREFVADGRGAGFIRRDPRNPRFFAYENGAPYYPIGCNAAWNSNGVVVETFLAEMGRTGQNWSRIWMNHWDNKNLDWVQDEKIAPGTLSLQVAKRWDGILAAAEAANVPFQMVFQHHGQYSESVNPNWDDNPWNAKNGGFLKTPDEFFTSEKARTYTRAKYRYILARYGYSPHILAWELFNEVQFTSSGRKRDYSAIAAWHKEMAAFLRQHDVHKHMITTSSEESITGLYDAMDYRQPHSYPPDLIGTIRAVGETFAAGKAEGKSDPQKPIFYGEIGTGINDLDKDDGTFLHQILWSGIMTTASGAAQYWTWDNIGKRKLIGAWKPATDFLRVFGLAGRREMLPVAVAFSENSRGAGAASFGGGGGWEGAKQTRYSVEPSGEVPGAGLMSPYLQGDNNRALLSYLEFAVVFDKPGTFAVRINQISKNGAKVAVSVDGKTLTEKAFPAAATDTAVSETLTVAVPAGSHTVRLQNSGQDWARIETFTLSPYGAPAKAVAKTDKETVAAWIYPAETLAGAKPLTGTVAVPGLDAGKYRVFWWDTRTGKTVATDTVTVASGKPLLVKTPPIDVDIALFAAHERVKGLPK